MATPAAVLSIIVEAQTGKAEAALKEFQRDLKKVDREKAEAVLAAEVEKGGFNVFSGLVKKADMEKADASLGVDLDQSEFAQAKAAQAVLAKESNKLSDVFNRSQLSIGQWTAALAAGLPVIIDLAGGLGALTASLGAATAGVGALAVGLGGAAAVGFAGIIAVMAPAISNLKDLKTAQDAYTLAVQRYGRGSTQAATALSLLQVQQKRAGPEATRFAAGLARVTRRWKELTEAGQGDFFGALAEGIGRLNRKLPLLAASANSSMKALRGGFTVFLDKATGPGFNHFIKVMTVTFAKSVGTIAAAFGNIAVVLERLAVAVAPDIVRMAKGFREITRGWVDSTRNARDLRETVHGLVNQAHAWWQLIKAAAELIVAVLVPGMGKGKKAVEGITQTLKGWTDWVKGHPREMRDFFKQGLETTKQLAQVLLSFLPQLFEISKAMRPIARAFLAITKALNSIKVGNVSALTMLLGAFVGAKLIRGIMGAVAAFRALKVAALGAAAASAAATGAGAGGGMINTAASGRVLARTTAGGGVAGGIGRGAATGRMAGVGRGLAGLLGLGAGGAAIASVAAPLAAIAVAMKGIDETGLLDSGGPLKGTKIGSLLGIGDKSMEQKASIFERLARTGKRVDESFRPGNIRDFEKALEKAGEEGVDTSDRLAKLRDTVGFLATKVHGGGDVLKQLEKNLKGISTKKPQDAIRALQDRYGSLVVAGHNMSQKQRQAFIDMALTARDKGQITQKQLMKVTHAFTDNGRKWQRAMRRAARQIGISTKDLKRSVGDMDVDVSKKYEHMIRIHNKWVDWLTKNPKIPGEHHAPTTAPGGKHIGRAQGGIIPRYFQQGGRPRGTDTVPAMLTPGEFVIRRPAVKKVGLGVLKAINRLQGGGLVEDGMQLLQTGGRVAGAAHRAALSAGKSTESIEVKLNLEAGATKALVDDTRKAAKETSKALASELGKGHKTAGAGTKDFVKDEGKQFKVLRSDTESTTTKLKRDVIERFQDFRKGGLKATDSLKKGSGKDFGATQKDAVQRTQRLKQNVTDGFNKTRGNTLAATGKMKQGVGADYHNMAAAAGDGIQKLGAMTNRALKALGVKAIDFGVSVAKGGKGKGHQRGGHIYDPSVPAVGDHIPAMLEKGEFVVNSKAAKKHRAALEQINFKDAPRFAKGGIVAAGHLAEKMGLVPSENPAFGGVNAQHAPGSYHYKGLAIDVSGGDMRAYFKAVAKRWFGHGLAELFFDPIGRYVKNDAWIQGAIGGHSDHVHVAITSAFAGAMAEKVKRVLLKGQDGPLKDMGQKALDKIRGAANRYIEKKSPEAMEGKVLHGSGDVEKVFAQVAKKMSTSKIATLALGEAGFAESGMRDLAYGDASSQGALQLLSSTAAGLGVSPHDEAAIASLFFQRGFYGKGGANKLADQGLPAHLVAQNVQGSATPSGSNYAAQERSARGWMKRFSLRKGGIVAPFVGAFQQGGEVAQTGLGLLHKGEKVIPQKLQASNRGDGKDGHDHGGSTTFGSLNAIKKKVAKAMSERGTLARLDEGIDVVQRIAESTRSPSGSELSKGERAELIQLQQKLLGTLKRTRDLSERGLRIIKLSMRSLDRRVKRMQKRLDGDVKKGSKAYDHIKHLHKLVNRERDKKHPDRKQIGRWLKEVKKTQDEAKPGEKRAKKYKEEIARLQGKATKFKAAGPPFQESLLELQGLTGRSGRILDTQLSIQELEDAGKPQPLHLDELLAFAEAMRYGAFKIPAFAEGGIHKGGLALVGEKGPEVVKMPPASVHPITTTAVAPTINFDADIRVFVGDQEITDIVDKRITVKNRKTASRYRAGQVRR